MILNPKALLNILKCALNTSNGLKEEKIKFCITLIVVYFIVFSSCENNIEITKKIKTNIMINNSLEEDGKNLFHFVRIG